MTRGAAVQILANEMFQNGISTTASRFATPMCSQKARIASGV